MAAGPRCRSSSASRPRHLPLHHGGYSTNSPIFYTIPWNPSDYSVSGLGPGQSSRVDPMLLCKCLEDEDDFMDYDKAQQLRACRNHGENQRLDYSKAGFTYYHKKKQCICGFLSEYRKQYNRRAYASARQNPLKPWWNGRELTSKFDPKFPCYPMDTEEISTYSKDYRGASGSAAGLCFPEGEIERARNIIRKRWDTDYRGLNHKPIFASNLNLHYC